LVEECGEGQCHPKTQAQLLEQRWRQLLAGSFLQDHRNTAAPLLDQAEFAEDATDHPIAQAADPAPEIVKAQARDQHTQGSNFDSVVEAGIALGGL
jgi:hypothetical protein